MRRLLTVAVAIALPACGASAEPEPSGEVSGTMFVANKRGASLSRIDLATGEETHRAQTCENPHELAVSPDGERVMVACYSGTTVEVYSAQDLSPLWSVDLGENARVHSAVWFADGRVFAGAEGGGSLFVIDGGAGSDHPFSEIRSGEWGAHLLAVSADGSQVWGTIMREGSVARYDIDDASEANRREMRLRVEAVALSPDGTALWVGDNDNAMVFRLDPQTLETVAEIAVGNTPIRIAPHPSGDFVVTSNFGSGDLSVIDTATNEVVRTIPVSGSAEAVQVTLVFSADGSRLYAAETARDTIAEIDFASGEVLRRIATGPGGDGLAVID